MRLCKICNRKDDCDKILNDPSEYWCDNCGEVICEKKINVINGKTPEDAPLYICDNCFN